MSFVLTAVLFVILFVLQLFLRPKPNIENAKPAGLGDFQLPTATEGRAVPIVWGTIRLEGPNLIWYGDFSQEAITEEVETGMFSTEDVVIGFKYFIGLQMALCRGPLDALTKVWINEKIVFDGSVSPGSTFTIDEPELFGGDDLGDGGVEGVMRFRGGGPNQNVDSYIADFQKEGGDTPAYRGTSFVCPSDDATYIGNSPNLRPWAFEVRRIPTGPATGGDEGVGTNDKDANPVNVLFEILTDKDWGLGIDTADVDTANFAAVGTVLATEVNGFSFILDRTMEATEAIKLVEEQIDGVLFFNQIEAKYQINLARADYDVDLIPELTESNRVELVSFSRGAWEDTTNQVRVQFTKRGGKSKYKDTFAVAQDMANFRIQGGVNILSEVKMPGCKRKALANSIALRTLRGLSFPLAKATIIVDRNFYDVQPAQVVAFTDTVLGFTKFPMRIQRIDYGELEKNRIRLDLVQDIYAFSDGNFADPTDTSFDDQVDAFVDYPSNTRFAFEAPRAFVRRDPSLNGVLSNRIWCGTRRQLGEPMFKVLTRFNPGSPPSGSFVESGKVFRFFLVGELLSNLDAGTATPTTSVIVVPDPDSQLKIEDEFDDSLTTGDIGQNLRHLLLVNGEFMLVSSAQISGLNVQLNNVFRAALDSTHEDHLSGDKVYLIFVGGGIADRSFDDNDFVEVKLLPKSLNAELAEGTATAISITMDDRLIRPYPPSTLDLDTTEFATTVSLEAGGSAAEDFDFDVDFNRRDFRTSDEIEALTTDAAVLFPDYPTANNTTHDMEVRDDPDGLNTLLFTLSGSSAQLSPTRLAILNATDGVLPTRMRVVLSSKHDEGSKTGLVSRDSLVWDFDVTSALTGQFEFGGLDNGDISAVYTTTTAGTFNFTLSSAFSVGDVESRINGGSFSQLIAAGGTAGSIVGVSISDTIEVRHLSTDTTVVKQLDMAAAGAGQDGFAILFT